MRLPIRKTRPTASGELRVTPTIASVLSTAAPNEDAALAAVAKSGGGEDVQEATAAMLRAHAALVEAYGGKLPAAVRKAVEDVLPQSSDDDEEEENEDSCLDPTMDDGTDENDEPPPTIKTKKKKKAAGSTFSKTLGLGELSKEDAASLLAAVRDALPQWKADEIRKADPSMTRAQALAKAYTDDPSLWERQQEAQIARVEKNARDARRAYLDSTAQYERIAKEIQAREPKLTKQQAFVKAMKERPEVYSPFAPPVQVDDVAKAAEREAGIRQLEAKAARIREHNPQLTKEQAFVKAMEQAPELYRP